MAKPTQGQVDRLLESIEYPVNKTQLTERAAAKRTAQSLRSLLEQLPQKQYQAPANVRQELEKLEPTLRSDSPGRAEPDSESGPPLIVIPAPVRDALATARVRGTRLAGEAGTQLISRADEQRPRAAQTLASTAATVREASTKFGERGQPQIGQAASAAADKLEALSRYVEETDSRAMVRAAQDVARRSPLAVMAAGVAIGALVTRLVRSADRGQVFASEAPGQQGAQPGAIELLEDDHRQIRRLLRRGGSAAVADRSTQLMQIKQLLQGHERMEEEVFYPALQSNPATRDLVMESFAEHHVVDEIMSEIEQTDVADEMWKARFSAMQENLEHHITEEEEQLLPVATKALTKGELAELGRRMGEIKQVANQAASS